MRFFYPSLGHTDCIERLEDATRSGGLIVVTGESGLGKSLLMDVLVTDLANQYTVAIVREAARTDIQLLRAIISKAGERPSGRTGLELMSELRQLVIRVRRNGKSLRVLMDDAENLSSSQLELLRTVLSTISSTPGAIGVYLFARPEIVEKIERKRGLAAQVELRHALNPFSKKDTDGLVRHRTRESAEPGVASVHFYEEALTLIHSTSRGNPGEIVQIMNACLNRARERRLTSIDAPTARDAIASRRRPEPRLHLDIFPASHARGPSARSADLEGR